MRESEGTRNKRHAEERKDLRDLITVAAKDANDVQLATLNLLGLFQDAIHAGERERAETRNLLIPDENTKQERQLIGQQQRQVRWFEGVDWFKAVVAGALIAALATALVSLVQFVRPGPEKLPTPHKVQSEKASPERTLR